MELDAVKGEIRSRDWGGRTWGGCKRGQGAMWVRMGLGAVRDWAGGQLFGGVAWGPELWGAGVRLGAEDREWGREVCMQPKTPQLHGHSTLVRALSSGKERIWALPGPAPTSAPPPHLHPSQLHRWVPASTGCLHGDPAQGWGAEQQGWLCCRSLGTVRGCARAGGGCVPVPWDGQDKDLVFRL